ncbi:hypothetical protein NIES2100_04870 [Calothrix sp. NIES-2100]|uniref:hypothetical protein n=1 Tax=Calothrix sp. NIES-2100 TaxID=1954172 RepID=UPI000B5EAB06|nr:hypothetical protein NIES2100_04870 [Calothrix sp. NIES-2100]
MFDLTNTYQEFSNMFSRMIKTKLFHFGNGTVLDVSKIVYVTGVCSNEFFSLKSGEVSTSYDFTVSLINGKEIKYSNENFEHVENLKIQLLHAWSKYSERFSE